MRAPEHYLPPPQAGNAHATPLVLLVSMDGGDHLTSGGEIKMDSVQDHLKKVREERKAREKARIEKLRELNLKKYNKGQSPPKNANMAMKIKPVKNILSMNTKQGNQATQRKGSLIPKINKMQNGIPSESKLSLNMINKKSSMSDKHIAGLCIPLPSTSRENLSSGRSNLQGSSHNGNRISVFQRHSQSANRESVFQRPSQSANRESVFQRPSQSANRVSVFQRPSESTNREPGLQQPSQSGNREAGLQQPSQSSTRESVFERLYKPKPQAKPQIDNGKKITNDSKCLKKNIQTSNMLGNKRHTTFSHKTSVNAPVRRSISAVHLKRINKSELQNCIHKYASIGDKIDNAHLKDIDEVETITRDRVVSAIKSERKKVKFMTALSKNYNTPHPEEMMSRLRMWLQKRGKSFNSYHHLQCFGINHMSDIIRNVDLEAPLKIEFSEDENKENVAVESDSDDGSYMENMNSEEDNKQFDAWRKASRISESFELNESVNTTMTSAETPHNFRGVLYGALNDLTVFIKEGFEWEQCACWLRAIQEQFPSVMETAQYWECRAALEEHRGDFSASMECWERALAKGTERSVVEANLDQLLDKFMQLKISPNSGERRQLDPKMVDNRNVLKSTIIRFAVKQEKLRLSTQDPAKYTVTPVRRSGRLSTQIKRTPFRDRPTFKQFPQEAPTIKQIQETLGENLTFVPNAKLCRTP